MNSTSSTTQALAVALRHNPYLARRVGLLCKELNTILQKVAPSGKEIASAVYEDKMEREADNRQWRKIKVFAGDGRSITNEVPIFKAWAYYAPSGPQDFEDVGDYMRVSDVKMLWVSKKTITRYIRHLAKAMNCESPFEEDFEMVKQRRRGLKFDRTLAKVFLDDYAVNWYEGWDLFP